MFDILIVFKTCIQFRCWYECFSFISWDLLLLLFLIGLLFTLRPKGCAIKDRNKKNYNMITFEISFYSGFIRIFVKLKKYDETMENNENKGLNACKSTIRWFITLTPGWWWRPFRCCAKLIWKNILYVNLLIIICYIFYAMSSKILNCS